MLGLGLGVDRGGFVPSIPLLLDTYTGAAAAYSLRKLRTDYTGAAIRVRESATNTEADIGFSGGVLDTAALLAHTGANNGFVVTWYDQSGNAYNTTQSTAAAQPQIVSSGSVILENGKAALTFDGSNDYLSNATNNWSRVGTEELDIFTVVKSSTSCTFMSSRVTTSPFSGWQLRLDGTTGYSRILNFDGTNSDAAIGSTDYRGQHIIMSSSLHPSCYLYVNNVSQTATVTNNVGTYTPATNLLQIGCVGVTPTDFVNGVMQEVILYFSAQSANRTAIETNINAHYNIY